ncbi:MAG: DnaJ domain-containing protein [Alphaproteobacteria bacterium]|nr:DnaJ domain-containing protein [Alphaproteobacteria bacterium]
MEAWLEKVIDKDLYVVFGLNKNATRKQIMEARNKIAFSEHDDRPENTNMDIDRFTEANEAWAVLENASRRKKYDEARAKRSGSDTFDLKGFMKKQTEELNRIKEERNEKHNLFATDRKKFRDAFIKMGLSSGDVNPYIVQVVNKIKGSFESWDKTFSLAELGLESLLWSQNLEDDIAKIKTSISKLETDLGRFQREWERLLEGYVQEAQLKVQEANKPKKKSKFGFLKWATGRLKRKTTQGAHGKVNTK